MQNFHSAMSRPSRSEGLRPRPRSGCRRAAAGTAALLALLGPVLGSGTARAAAPSAASAASAGPARAATSVDRLLPGETLKPGQSISAGHDALTMQGNGNLVLVAPGHTPLWSSHTSGDQGAQLVMQPNGNLTVVAPGGQALWSAGTSGHSGSMLVLQPNGNAVVAAPASSAPPSSAPPSSAPPSTEPLGASPSSTPLWSTDTFRQTYADLQLAAHGWSRGQAAQFACLDHIWARESKWNERAGSPGSAYGIPQASPGAKMAAAGPDWLTSPQTQIRWGEDYIAGQYGTPCQAWAYWQVHRNY